MSLKSIIAVASGESDDAEALGAAGKLAARFGAHVRVTPAFPDPAADFVYYGAALRTETTPPARIAEAEREIQGAIETRARDVAAREGLSTDTEIAGPSIMTDKRALLPAAALAPAAVLADLVVFSGTAAREALSGLFAETLLSTRAPVLLAKGAAIDGPIAVAWDGSAQSARAARAALPLLQAAPGVLIVRNTDDATSESEASAPERLRTYLAQHGVADVALRAVRGDRVADSLLKAAQADGCGVLVAGAFGRPRLFEMALGGTTRALVKAEGGPNIMLAH